MLSTIKNTAKKIRGFGLIKNSNDAQDFLNDFYKNYFFCEWKPHLQYSVFNQYDKDYYLAREDDFAHKYRCFYTVSKTISPQKILELGTHAGSSADAYISAAPTADYLGIDMFGECTRHDDGSPWKPYEVAQQLFEARGFKNYELLKADLRQLNKLPRLADFVVVDAAHDFENEYGDLQLALTAEPKFIFVDDVDGKDAAPAVKKFLNEDLKDKIDFTAKIDYIGGGLVIKLKTKT